MKLRKFSTMTTAIALLAISSHAMADEPDGSVPAMAEGLQKNPLNEMTKKVSDALGIKLWGYGRGGFYAAAGGQPKGGYSLGGDLQKYRLGNEGDNYLEFGIGKVFDLGGGMKWGTYYMPKVYNGDSGTAQAYTEISGLSFAPELSFWAGQRYHRIQDIHIVDNWLMEDGDNYGAGVDGFGLGGGAKLNVALHTQGNADNHNSDTNNGRRFNFQVVDIPVNPGGKLSVTGALISGKFAQGKDGGALGLLHNQKDFLVNGLTNSVFVQASTGHASINGKFYNLDTAATAPSLVQDSLGTVTLVPGTPAGPRPGAQQRRIVEVMNWQVGKLGGQALLGYQTIRPDGGSTQKDLSVGGRVSYGIARNTKLLGEIGTTARKIEGQESQRLSKYTAAVAFSPNTDFWNRPEFRVYATRATWNDAAAAANSGSFGRDGRTHATMFGVQMEAWWE